MSSQQRVSVSETFFLNFLFFKTLHVIEYAILNVLWFRAFLRGTYTGNSIKTALQYAFIVSILYAISDEIHQTLVPTREGTIRDVLIDCVGISLMYIYLRNNVNIVKRFLL